MYVLYCESAILDAVGIATHHCTKIRVIGFGVVQVGSATVVAKDNILGVAILVRDKEIGKSGAVRYKACIDARRGDGVLGEDTRTARVLS